MANAVYVHIPYCISKCPYCDFVSIPIDASIDAYLMTLAKEIQQRASSANGWIPRSSRGMTIDREMALDHETMLDGGLTLDHEMTLNRKMTASLLFTVPSPFPNSSLLFTTSSPSFPNVSIGNPSSKMRVDTIYVGGGTPTVLEPEKLAFLFDCLNDSLEIPTGAEITVEANPCSLSPAKAEALAAAGVNRISLGAQSFVNSELRTLGRIHKTRDIYTAVSLLRKAGIGNLNLDLIFGIPGQTKESWRHSLSEALSLAPEHISTYCLTFEPGTPYRHRLDAGEIHKKSEDEELEMYESAREVLLAEGYEHYEISNFALSGRRSAHNIVYWHNEEYLGLGASAVSYIGGKRISNVRRPAEYIQSMETTGNAIAEVEEIPPHMQAIETMLQHLRLNGWLNCESFSGRFGIHPVALFGDAFDSMVEAGLIEFSGESIRSTFRGWQLANEVALKLLP